MRLTYFTKEVNALIVKHSLGIEEINMMRDESEKNKSIKLVLGLILNETRNIIHESLSMTCTCAVVIKQKFLEMIDRKL